MTPAPIVLRFSQEIPLRPCVGAFELALESSVMVAVSPIFVVRHDMSEFVYEHSERTPVYREINNSKNRFGLSFPVPQKNRDSASSKATISVCKRYLWGIWMLEVSSKFLCVLHTFVSAKLNLLELRPGRMFPLILFVCSHTYSPFKDRVGMIPTDATTVSNAFFKIPESMGKCEGKPRQERASEKFGGDKTWRVGHWHWFKNKISTTQKLIARIHKEIFFEKCEFLFFSERKVT